METVNLLHVITLLSVLTLVTCVDIACYETACISSCDLALPDGAATASCNTSCQLTYFKGADGDESISRSCSLEDCISVYSDIDSLVTFIGCCDDNLCNTDIQAFQADPSDGDRCYSCHGMNADGVCGTQVDTSSDFILTETCQKGCQVFYVKSESFETYQRSCITDECTPAYSDVVGYLTVQTCCQGDLCNSDITATPPAGDKRCYSCAADDTDGPCGETVDASHSLIPVEICEEGCQLTYVKSGDTNEEQYIRGCAANCTSGMASGIDGSVASVSCCEGDLCNTDIQDTSVCSVTAPASLVLVFSILTSHLLTHMHVTNQ